MNRVNLLFFVARAATFVEAVPFLGSSGFNVTTRPLEIGAPLQVSLVRPDLVVIEHSSTCSPSGFDIARRIRDTNQSIPLILATNEGSEELAIKALRLGLQDYVKFPCPSSEFLGIIKRHVIPTPSATAGAHPLSDGKRYDPGRMIAASDSMQDIQNFLGRVARSDCTVLVTGETGTGKELVAEFIHQNSRRRKKPFVCVNCAAIPDSLLESELFGHTKGAFTGAQEGHDGLLCAADGGTVFLDEIGDMSSFAQAKILRVLETQEFCRLGGTKQVRLDLRFIAATNQDLHAMATQKTFRQDLLFRLDVAHVHLPPLRERKDDIPALVREFGKRFSWQAAAELPEFSEDFLRALLRYSWPGNIRELKNVIESLFLKDLRGAIGAEHLPARLRQFLGADNHFSESERDLLLSTLFSTRWNKTRAAEKLHWSRMTLYRKIAKYQIRGQFSAKRSAENESARPAT
jgi:DNA-binding NtrC family response regulator